MRIVALLLAFGLAVVGLATPATALQATTVTDAAVTISAAPASAGVLRPGQDLVLTGSATNMSRVAMDAGTATAYLGRSALKSRSALQNWLNPEEDASNPGRAVGSVAIGELGPGQSRAFTITVPTESIGVDISSFGTYSLLVELSTGDDPRGQSRSAIVVAPDETTPSTALSIASVITVPPNTTGVIDAESIAAYTAPGGLLTTQLDQASGRSVAIGIDPMIVASIRALGTSAPESALEWLDRLAAVSNETFALAYADADLALWHQAGATTPLAPISFRLDPNLFAPDDEDPGESPTPTPDASQAPPEVPPLPTDESLLEWDHTIPALAWPGDGTVAVGDLEKFAESGYGTTILSSSAVSSEAPGNPRVTFGEQTGVVSDDRVSHLLRDAVGATTDAAWQAAMAALSATLAVATADNNGGALLGTLGRDAPSFSYRLAQTLDTLQGLPWVSPALLTDILALTPGAAKLVDQPEPAERVSAVASMFASESQVAAFSSVLDDPTLLTGPRRLAFLALLSQSWVSKPSGWADAAAQFILDCSDIVNAVRIPESSTITFPLDSGDLPIVVSNDLALPVTVYVTVRPERPILDVIDSRVEVTIEANSQARAAIPVQSVANGQVRAQVSLRSATDVPISRPTTIEVNVQAGWETAATFVLAGLVVLLFGAGIWRTIIRRRRLRASLASTGDNA